MTKEGEQTMANENRLDLISRKALIAEYDRVHIGPPGGARKLMEEAPTVDAVEVVHGRWINSKGEIVPLDEGCPVSSCNCNVCGEWLTASDEYACIGKYCPNCGAKMDGGNEDV
jgi:hypothetical protein